MQSFGLRPVPGAHRDCTSISRSVLTGQACKTFSGGLGCHSCCPMSRSERRLRTGGHLPASASPVLGGKSDAGDWGALRLPVPAAWWHTMTLGSVCSRGGTQVTQGLSCFHRPSTPNPAALGRHSRVLKHRGELG